MTTTRSARRRRAKERRRAASAGEPETSPTVSSPPAAAAYPRWVLISFWSEREEKASSHYAAEATTMAAARGTTGRAFRVSFQFVPPPGVSRMLVGFLHGGEASEPEVLAAHGDSVLFQMSFDVDTTDHFVYNAAVADGPSQRPPTVSLLPLYYLTEKELEKHVMFSSRRGQGPVHRELDLNATGLLRRGDHEFVVVELKMVEVMNDEHTPSKTMAELVMFRSDEWIVQRPEVKDGGGDVPSSWKTRAVLPLGEGLLCWVDVSCGLIFCNVFDEIPELRFVPLPTVPYRCNVSVTAGGHAVRYVNIFPRCCCGAEGTTDCYRSEHAYIINTWILRIQDMAWEMDGMVDSTEIWALDAYEGLPRVPPVCPFVSIDDPHIVCFAVSEIYFVTGGESKEWHIMLDLRSKTLLSVCHGQNSEYGHRLGLNIFPSRISGYFNPYPTSSSSSVCSSSMIENHTGMVAPPVKDSLGNNCRLIIRGARESSKMHVDPAIHVSDVLEVFREIPNYGLAHHDMIKAISMLSHDSGRRFKSLLELPMSMRKDWLLMEIKASEA